MRSTSIELEALPVADSAQLVEALVAGESAELTDEERDAVLETTEGNPLFIEETVRMLLESGGQSDGIPHTVQAMISARIDRLPETERTVLRRAAVAGRVFWSGAIEELGDSPIKGGELHDLVERDFLVLEPRSTIRGEEAYRFKHVLIRDVAYAGLSKSSRALLHRQMAQWLAERPVADELVEIRAFHLDVATQLAEELEGAVPEELATETADALEQAGRRALAREANNVARRLFSRSVELEPNLERRYLAAHAAWRMSDFPTVSAEMHEVSEAASSAGDHRVEVRALTALARVSLFRDADNACARELAGRALAVVEQGDDVGRFDALEVIGTVSYWEGDLEEVVRLANERLAIAERIGRADLQSGVLLELNDVYNARLETERAHEPLALAIELAEDERQPDDAGLDPARVRPAGRARGPPRRRRGRARRGASDLHRERGDADARPHAELARRRRSGTSATSTGPRRPCGRRFACSSRSRTGGRSSRASASWRRCCSTRGASRRRSASRSNPARPSAPATCRRARRRGLRSGSSGRRRGRTTRPSGSCGSQRRSCGRPGSGAIRSRRSRRSPSSSARATATTRRSRSRRRWQRSSAARSRPGRQDESVAAAPASAGRPAGSLRRGRESP